MGFSTNWKGTHNLYAYIQLYEFNNIVSSVGSSYFDTLYSIFFIFVLEVRLSLEVSKLTTGCRTNRLQKLTTENKKCTVTNYMTIQIGIVHIFVGWNEFCLL